jgi:NADH-quinone oxidoreductase subunit G
VRGVAERANVSENAQAIAASLASGKNVAILLGNLAQHHPRASELHLLALALAEVLGARMGFLGEAANSVGGYLAGAVPFGAARPGMNARQMLAEPRKAYLLLGAEAELDTADPQQAVAAMKSAELVVAMSPYQHGALDYAHVLLPIAPFTETSGTFVSTEGTAQSFSGIVRPLGEARPAWKVLRVLGNLLGLAGFEQDSAEEVRHEALGEPGSVSGRLANAVRGARLESLAPTTAKGVQRIAEVPIFAADAIVRRARSLQQTRDAQRASARMNRVLFEKLRLRSGDNVRIRQGAGEAVLAAAVDDGVPENCVRVPTGCAETSTLGAMFGEVSLERAPAEEKMAV